MFNPEQAGRLRAALERGASIQFDDYTLRTVPVPHHNLPLGADVLHEAPLETHDFYGPERIIGTPADASCLNAVGTYKLTTPSRRLFRVADACVIGSPGVLSPTGVVFAPDPITSSEQLRKAQLVNRTNYQGFVMWQQGGADTSVLATFMSHPTPSRIRKNAFFAYNLEGGNYGSFIFRQLPQLMLPAGLQSAFDCYIVPDRTSWFLEACNLLGLPQLPTFTAREVAGQKFDSIMLWGDMDNEGFVPHPDRATLSRIIAGKGPRTGPKRIFTSRSLSTIHRPSYRRCLNEGEVESTLQEHGFQVVHPETLSLRAQARLFAGAKQVAGLSGSGMLNTFFARPGTQVMDFESFTFTVRQHAKLYSSGQLRYAFGFGTLDATSAAPPYLRSWTIPQHVLDEAMVWLATSKGRTAKTHRAAVSPR